MDELSLRVIQLSIQELSEAATRDYVTEADVILGHDVRTGKRVLFFGDDVLERVRETGDSHGVMIIEFALDFATDQTEYLARRF